MDPPKWNIEEAENNSAVNLSKEEFNDFLALRFIYNCFLKVDNLTFQGDWSKSKIDAKKNVAAKAFYYFKDQGNPFFTESRAEKLILYSQKLYELTVGKNYPLK